jgi:hypothetical protein
VDWNAAKATKDYHILFLVVPIVANRTLSVFLISLLSLAFGMMICFFALPFLRAFLLQLHVFQNLPVLLIAFLLLNLLDMS